MLTEAIAVNPEHTDFSLLKEQLSLAINSSSNKFEISYELISKCYDAACYAEEYEDILSSDYVSQETYSELEEKHDALEEKLNEIQKKPEQYEKLLSATSDLLNDLLNLKSLSDKRVNQINKFIEEYLA